MFATVHLVVIFVSFFGLQKGRLWVETAVNIKSHNKVK